MTEPLAVGRDEVIYLVCTHPRVVLGQRLVEGWRSVYRAGGPIGGPFEYDMDNPWARVRFPEEVRPSALGWAVLDPLLETVEGLPPDASFDSSRDPEGEDGRHRQELLAWIFDRHLELDGGSEVDRGAVEGSEIDFRLEYIGKAGYDAVRRATGPHHKVPLILSRTLLYEPDRLVYLLPCEIRAATYDSTPDHGTIEVPPLSEAVRRTGIARDVLISVAEEALISAIGAPQNLRNTGSRRFPASQAGDRLTQLGITDMVIAFGGIPQRTAIQGERRNIDCNSSGMRFQIPPASSQGQPGRVHRTEPRTSR